MTVYEMREIIEMHEDTQFIDYKVITVFNTAEEANDFMEEFGDFFPWCFIEKVTK